MGDLSIDYTRTAEGLDVEASDGDAWAIFRVQIDAVFHSDAFDIATAGLVRRVVLDAPELVDCDGVSEGEAPGMLPTVQELEDAWLGLRGAEHRAADIAESRAIDEWEANRE